MWIYGEIQVRAKGSAWIGPHGEGKAKEEASRRQGRLPFQKARASSGAQAKVPSRGWPASRTSATGARAEHRAGIQPCRPDGQNVARVPSPTQPGSTPLCLMPAGKQEASPFVAIAGLVSLQVGQSSHWLLSFIFWEMPHPLDKETGHDFQAEWRHGEKPAQQVQCTKPIALDSDQRESLLTNMSQDEYIPAVCSSTF